MADQNGSRHLLASAKENCCRECGALIVQLRTGRPRLTCGHCLALRSPNKGKGKGRSISGLVGDDARQCRGCKKVRPLAEFHRQKAGNGYRATCKTCVAAKFSVAAGYRRPRDEDRRQRTAMKTWHCAACNRDVLRSEWPRGKGRTKRMRCADCSIAPACVPRAPNECFDRDGNPICRYCREAKPPSDFYTHGRTGRARSSCIECCKARSRQQKKRARKKRMAEERAAERRKYNPDLCVYVPKAIRMQLAQVKRQAKALEMLAGRLERAMQRAQRPPAIGTKAWYAVATPEQIDAYRAGEREAYRIRYATKGDQERARQRAYKHANPHVVARGNDKRKRLAAHQADGTLTREVVVGLFEAATRCPYCQTRMTNDKTLDHIAPLSRGGAHGVHNVLVCCRTCNISKRAQPFDEWMARLPADQAARMGREFARRFGAPPQQQGLALQW